jgi:hypothetical protein
LPPIRWANGVSALSIGQHSGIAPRGREKKLSEVG